MDIQGGIRRARRFYCREQVPLNIIVFVIIELIGGFHAMLETDRLQRKRMSLFQFLCGRKRKEIKNPLTFNS